MNSDGTVLNESSLTESPVILDQEAPGYGCLFSWQFFMSARALTMEEMENVNGGLVLRVYWHPKRARQNPKKA